MVVIKTNQESDGEIRAKLVTNILACRFEELSRYRNSSNHPNLVRCRISGIEMVSSELLVKEERWNPG